MVSGWSAPRRGLADRQGALEQAAGAVQVPGRPEPLEEAHPHPNGERVEPEQVLARVLTRDGSKTLASEIPFMLDVRRLSTRQLREQRNQLAELRASCPPDRSRELARARERAEELEAARRAAQAERETAIAALAQVEGRLLRRREAAAARDRLTLAEHALKTLLAVGSTGASPLGMRGSSSSTSTPQFRADKLPVARQRWLAW
jgi:hypothetical protein